jgi:hypothetical protein
MVVDGIDKIVANEGYQIQLVGNTEMKMLLDFQSVVDAIMDVMGVGIFGDGWMDRSEVSWIVQGGLLTVTRAGSNGRF